MTDLDSGKVTEIEMSTRSRRGCFNQGGGEEGGRRGGDTTQPSSKDEACSGLKLNDSYEVWLLLHQRKEKKPYKRETNYLSTFNQVFLALISIYRSICARPWILKTCVDTGIVFHLCQILNCTVQERIKNILHFLCQVPSFYAKFMPRK